MDIVDRDKGVEFYGFLYHCLSGESWELTLGNHCMQSSQSVGIRIKAITVIFSRSDNDRV